jgi:hypothetical protein
MAIGQRSCASPSRGDDFAKGLRFGTSNSSFEACHAAPRP